MPREELQLSIGKHGLPKVFGAFTPKFMDDYNKDLSF